MSLVRILLRSAKLPCFTIYIPIRSRNNDKFPDKSLYLMHVVNCEADTSSYFQVTKNFHAPGRFRAQLLSSYILVTFENYLKYFVKQVDRNMLSSKVISVFLFYLCVSSTVKSPLIVTKSQRNLLIWKQ